MTEKKSEILYSDDVKEIISAPPGRIIRWGTAIISVVFAALILLAWLVRYPDVIPSTVEITTQNPPATLVTKISGRINKLYVKNGENVSKGQLLAVMETAASIKEIENLREILDTITNADRIRPGNLPSFNYLGELQSEYTAFLKSLNDFDTYIQNDLYGSKISAVNVEISGIGEYLSRLRVKESLLAENLSLEENKYRRDSILHSGKVYSESEIENSRQALIRMKLELQQVRLEHSAKVIGLSEKRQQLQDYIIMRQEEKEKLISVLNESFLNLKAGLNIWINNYLLITPVDGQVTFTRYWSENQSVLKDEPVLSIVPDNAGDYVGRINLKMNRSGKVMTGQIVNIKLSGYPYLEYGMIRGVISSKSLVASGDFYVIEIILPQGLTTLYGRELAFSQNMQGIAEIITNEMSLLQKIVNPFRYLASKNRKL
jgi:HlyD family secretion protein